MKLRVIFCCVLIVVLVCSCSAHRVDHSSLQEVEAGTKVLIETQNLGFLFRLFTLFLFDPSHARIRKVDGEWIPASLLTNDRLALEPGGHTFELACESGDGDLVRVENRAMYLDVRHRYIITCSVYQGFTIKEYLATPNANAEL